jgi:hypothetical protein
MLLEQLLPEDGRIYAVAQSEGVFPARQRFSLECFPVAHHPQTHYKVQEHEEAKQRRGRPRHCVRVYGRGAIVIAEEEFVRPVGKVARDSAEDGQNRQGYGIHTADVYRYQNLGISVIELEFRTFVVVVQFLLRVPVRQRGLDNNVGREIHSLTHSHF